MKTFLYLLVITFFFSCSKDNAKKDSGNALFEYKVNGQLVSIKGINISSGEGAAFSFQSKSNYVPANRYQLNAQKGLNNVFIASIYTDNLKPGVYRYDSLGLVKYNLTINSVLANGDQSMLYFSTDYLEFNFSQVSESSASGTFSGKFTPIDGGIDYEKKSTVVISEGKFTNIPIIK